MEEILHHPLRPPLREVGWEGVFVKKRLLAPANGDVRWYRRAASERPIPTVAARAVGPPHTR